MKKFFILTVFSLYQISILTAQTKSATDKSFDQFVRDAIVISENSIYEANLIPAKKIVDVKYFKEFPSFNSKHLIMLTVQNLRIDGFTNTLYQSKTDAREGLRRLSELLPQVRECSDKKVVGDYFVALASAYWSVGNQDSALHYENNALILFNELNNFESAARIRVKFLPFTTNC